MLVLTRRSGEALHLDGDIRVVVLGVTGGVVRIGIEAPPECSVLRGELHERIARANLEAAFSKVMPGAEAPAGANLRNLAALEPADQPSGESL